jgi:hypothetical protein
MLAQALAEVAPPHARLSAERATRVLAIAGRDAGEETPADSDLDDARGVMASSREEPDTAGQLGASWRDTERPAARPQEPSGTVPPVMTSASSRRRARLMRAGRFGVVTLLAGGATLAFASVRRDDRQPAAAPVMAVRAPVAIASAAAETQRMLVEAPARILAPAVARAALPRRLPAKRSNPASAKAHAVASSRPAPHDLLADPD